MFLVLILGLRFDKRKWSNSAQRWWAFEWLVLVLLAGLRYRVGGDTLGYFDMHSNMPTLVDLAKEKNLLDLQYMPLWHLFVALCLQITKDFVFLQIIEAIIVNSVIFWFIKKYANRPFLTVIFYFFMIYPYYNMEMLRQVLSVCCFLLAIPSLIEKKFVRYYLWTIVALGFHHSAIVLLLVPPIYYFMKDAVSKYFVFFMIAFVLGLTFVTQMDTVSSTIRTIGLMRVGDEMEISNMVGNITIFGTLFRLLTEWLVAFLFLVLYKQINSNARAFLALYVFFLGVGIPVYLMYRIVDYFTFPFYIVILNCLDDLVLSKRKSTNVLKTTSYCSEARYIVRAKKPLGFVTFLSVLLVLNVMVIRINYYMLDRSIVTGKQGSYFYNLYVPYSSVFDPEEYPWREEIYYNQTKL